VEPRKHEQPEEGTIKQNAKEDPSLKLFIVMSRAYRAINERLHESVRREGLNPTEFAVLELLYHNGDTPLQQIGEKILIASGTITYVVDKLQEKKLLYRMACEKDRRVTYGVISEEGRALMDRIFPPHRDEIERMFGVLTEEERKVMTELLKKVGYYVRSLQS
jgi:MarR family transcriptional regulator, 2-MHQ and catechol-resistance regulon repressor